MSIKSNLQNEINNNLDSKLQNYMEAITNMCSRIENNVTNVTNQINSLEKRIGNYETQLNSMNESKIINVLNESRYNNKSNFDNNINNNHST